MPAGEFHFLNITIKRSPLAAWPADGKEGAVDKSWRGLCCMQYRYVRCEKNSYYYLGQKIHLLTRYIAIRAYIILVLCISQWLQWFCEAGGSPDEARLEQTQYPFQPHYLALFRHKITLYRFNQGGSYYCRGLKWEWG